MSTDNIVELPFLGSRNYLHGTTLFRHLIRNTPDISDICFRIRKKISSNRVEIRNISSSSIPKDASALIEWKRGAIAERLGVFSLELREPIRREEYPESLVTHIANVTGKKITVDKNSPFDIVATAVPMFKKILAAHDLSPIGGQWMFSRLDVPVSKNSFKRIELCLTDLRNNMVARSSITLDDVFYGDLYFSWVFDTEITILKR